MNLPLFVAVEEKPSVGLIVGLVVGIAAVFVALGLVVYFVPSIRKKVFPYRDREAWTKAEGADSRSGESYSKY